MTADARLGTVCVDPAIPDNSALDRPLDSAWLKLAWATEHLKELATDIEAFLDSDDNEVIAERQTRGRYVLRLKLGQIPLVRWGLIFGDALHGLRGALDHAAWQMVVRDHGGPPEKVRDRNRIQFPIYDSPEAFEKATVLRYIGDGSRTVLQEAQPDPGGKFHPLQVLAALSNDDKHRLLIPAICAFGTGNYKFRVRHNQSIASVSEPVSAIYAEDDLEDGAVLGYIDARIEGPNPQMHVECAFPGFIAFRARDGVVIELGTIGALTEYVHLVLKRVDLLFQGLVPEP